MKNCIKCGSLKPISDFYAHPMMADGTLNKCKECARADALANRAKNIDRIRAYDIDRSKSPQRIASRTAATREWRSRDKRRAAAHTAVARAIRNGVLTKCNCERCGSANTLAHHEDYDKPLDVMWLCQPCHKARHKEIDQQKKAA